MIGDCERFGHAPPDVEHLSDWRTRIRCPSCKKSVIEHGLEDHPDAINAKIERQRAASALFDFAVMPIGGPRP